MESEDIAAIQELVRAQFRSLSWTRQQEPDWTAFTRGFLPGAALFPAARPVKPRTVDQFVERMKKLRAEGKLVSFEETPLGCTMSIFGNVAVAFAACEMLENGSTLNRDVSAITLVRDGGTWRIVAQAWDIESESRKIPAALAAREDH
jgi:hypothetical protein